MNKVWPLIVLGTVAVLLFFFRLAASEPIGYSVSTGDTQRFVSAARIPFFSKDFFTSDVPTTIGLVYKLFEPATGYQITAFSSPAENIYQAPMAQPGLQRVAFAQSLFSIIAWFLLSVVLVRRLRDPGLKIIGFLLILAFGFSPPIVEWDAIQLSESISLSLFIVWLSISIELVARLDRGPIGARPWSKTLIVLWVLVLILWVFARDTNAYMLLILLVASILVAVLTWRGKVPGLKLRNLLVVVASLLLLFLIQNAAVQQSGRLMNPFFNNLLRNVLPYPGRVAFFEAKGMPISDEVWALRFSTGNEDGFFRIPDLVTWTRKYGTSTYVQFLLSEPGWAIEKFFVGLDETFSENRQPFFVPPDSRNLLAWSYIGDLLHPKSSSVVWIALAELVVFGFVAFRRGETTVIALFALFLTLYLGALLMLFVSIHGDPIGVVRHALGSVVPLRLSLWLLPPFILDVYNFQEAI